MGESETYIVNDTMRQIRRAAEHLNDWAKRYPENADMRHVAMVLTKLEEAELISQRIVKEEISNV
jgi:hypothetical protein